MNLSLSRAIREDRLADFIAQEEARGVAPVHGVDFDTLAAKVIRTSRSADQTSGSFPTDGSSGK